MKNEKIALIALVVIIAGVLSVYLVATYGGDIFENLFGEEETIEFGDCVDINYIGRYASNDTVFDSSYEYVENKTGGTPLQVFVSLNKSAFPDNEEYMYYSPRPLGMIEGFISDLVGMKEGETKTIGPIPPEKAYGIKPVVGDIVNLSELGGGAFKIVNIIENTSPPPEWIGFGIEANETIDMYTLRDESHYIGEKVEMNYPSWENSSVVTKINETLIWMHITPPYEVGENFSWIDLKADEPATYPENTTTIISINETTIVLKHTPSVDDTIQVQVGYSLVTYTVENLTSDKIIVYENQSGNKTYKEFNRTAIIQRNETQEITIPVPDISLDQIFLYIRELDNSFILSLGTLADETVYFEIEIVDIHKAS